MKRGICAMCKKPSVIARNHYCKKCRKKRMRAYRASTVLKCEGCGCTKIQKTRDDALFQSMLE